MENFFEDFGASDSLSSQNERRNTGFIIPESGCMGIFDGHGKNGFRAVNWASVYFSEQYEEDRPFNDKGMHADFNGANTLIRKMIGNGAGGTTATIVKINRSNGSNSSIACANVGDSPALLVNPEEETFLELTTMHNKTNLKEVARLGELGISLAQDCTDGGTLSRSLGDFDKSEIMHRPSIRHQKLRKNGKNILIVATSGALGAENYKNAAETAIEGYRRKKSMLSLANELAASSALEEKTNARVFTALI